MSKLGIGTGITPDDGNGDSLLDGAVKINSNFNEIYSYFGDGTNLSGSWQKVSSGINTTLNVGVGTTNPRFRLEVGAVGASGTSLYVNGNARVTGILTVGSSSITLDGSNNILKVGTGVTIYGNSGIVSATDFYAGELRVSSITADTIIYEGSTLYNAWDQTSAGINTLSNVGIGTTNPTSALTVTGVSSFRGTLNADDITMLDGIFRFNSSADGAVLDMAYTPSSDKLDISYKRTGDLTWYIPTNTTFQFKNPGGGNLSAKFTSEGTSALYYAGSNKIETANTGAVVTGILTATYFVGDGSGLTNLPGGGGGGGESYWVSTSAGIHTLSSVGIGTTNPRTTLQIENIYGIDAESGSFSASSGTPYTGNSWTISSTNFRTAEYTLWFQHSSGIQSQKVLIINNGTIAYSQEYAIMHSTSSPLISIGATVESGQVRMKWTPESGVSGIITYRFTRETML